MPSYEQLSRVGIRAGQEFTYTRRHLTPTGIEDTVKTDQVERLAGGGFNGAVVLFEKKVAKTPVPDAFHQLLRERNWKIPYPSLANETAAQLTSLSGEILHLTVPALTDGEIITPEVYGYSRLDPSLGYAQILERMRGRGPHFDDGGVENEEIRVARQQVWDLRHKIGAEHTAQVHPDNPFGKPNIWIGETGQKIWLDYIPAIRHTGKVWPWFFFPFHEDAQRAFGRISFDQLNTDTLRQTLKNEADRWSLDEHRILDDKLDQYDDRLEIFSAWEQQDPKELYIADALERGQVTKAQADQMRISPVAYEIYQAKHLASLGLNAFLDKVTESPARILWNQETQKNLIRFFRNPVYRRKQILEHTTLLGIKQAYEHGLVSEEEFDEAISFVSPRELRTYVGLQTWYFLNSRLTDALTAPLAVAAYHSDQRFLAGAGVTAFNILLPGIVRGISTAITGAVRDVDLKKAARVSLLPFVGNYTAIPFQIKEVYGEKADDLMHYTLRALVSAMSKVRPWGGWNSDLEEKIWNTGEKTIARSGEIYRNTKEKGARAYTDISDFLNGYQ